MSKPAQSTSEPISLPDVAAFVFTGDGRAEKVELGALPEIRPGDNAFSFAWVHLRRDHHEATDWLRDSGLDAFVIEALTADETRPRCTVHGDGAVLNLRGVNLNPGAEPEDMISARLWIEEKRVVGVWLRPLRAVADLFEAIERNQAPSSPGDLIASLALRLADRTEPTVAALNERIDQLEERVFDVVPSARWDDLGSVRRTSIVLRRYMFPQRDALTTFEIEPLHWLGERDRSRIREASERVTRLCEELDAIRDRAQVVHDQIMDQRAERMNRQMLLLSIVAAIFLPLGLLTGLLGINVGGIPGAESPWGFTIVTALLVVIGAGQWLVFRWLGLFK